MINLKKPFSVSGKHFLLFALITVCLPLVYTTCGGPGSGFNNPQGTVTVSFGNNASASSLNRSSVTWPPDNPDNYILDKIDFEIIFTNSGGSKKSFSAKGEQSINVTVPVGNYSVQVDAYYQNAPYARGNNTVDVKAGQKNIVGITMYQTLSGNGDDGKNGDGNGDDPNLPPDGSGSGTETDPFIVGSEDSLRKVGSGENGWTLSANYKMTADITLLNTNWTPIGPNNATPFTGTFDGNGKTISNLTISTLYDNSGLFGHMNGKVSNLGLVGLNININLSVSAMAYIGCIAGYNQGTIENCYVTGTITITGFSGSEYVGGVVGNNAGFGSIENCYSTVTITGSNVGGLAGGGLGSAVIKNCVALNPTITGMQGSNFSRVANGSSFINNYARDDMLIGRGTPSVPTADIGPDEKNGENVSAGTGNDQYNSQAFWQNTMDWDFTNVWRMSGGTNSLPVHR